MTKDCHTGRFLPPGTSPPVADCRQHRAGQKVAGASAARQHLACGRHRISGEPVRQARTPGFAHGRGGPTARKRPSACPSASPSHPLASRERYGRVRVIVSGVLFQRPPALSPGAVCEELSRVIESLFALTRTNRSISPAMAGVSAVPSQTARLARIASSDSSEQFLARSFNQARSATVRAAGSWTDRLTVRMSATRHSRFSTGQIGKARV